MLKTLDGAFRAFEHVFSRAAPKKWFAAAVVGMMLREDKLGMTSVIRALSLKPRYYSMLNVLRSTAWSLHGAERAWTEYVAKEAPLFRMDGIPVLVVDGVVATKEGARIPGVVRLYQDSANSAKPDRVFGHLHGAVGVLASAHGKTHCIPLACELQEGVREIMSWIDWRDGCVETRQGGQVAEAMSLAHDEASRFGKAYLLADRYYLCRTALDTISSLNESEGSRLELVSLAKRNAVAYEKPPARAPGKRGRPLSRGAKVKLDGLFVKRASEFETAVMEIYGKPENVRYLATNLLWGKGKPRELRFVLTSIGDRRLIIATTATEMEPQKAIRLYAKRFCIEHMFRSMKQDAGAFSYRCWTSSMPKLNRFARSGVADRVCGVADGAQREKIARCVEANERYAFIGAVATGLLQMLSLKLGANAAAANCMRYQRTPSKRVPSEAAVADYLRKAIFRMLAEEPDLSISKKIGSLMASYPGIYERKRAA